MTDENIIGDLANVKSQLIGIKSLVQDISGGFKSWRADSPMGKSSGAFSGDSGNSMQGSLAAVSSTSNSAFGALKNAAASTPGIWGGGIATTALGLGQTAVNFGLGMISANAVGMPGVGDVLNRAATYYNAGTSTGGGVSRKVMEAATFGTMRGGMTSPNSDANVAQYLTGAGMQFSASSGSTYQQTLRSVSNAAKYLNMPNEQAAAAIENLTSGSTSAQLMGQYGIWTADPRTGKEYTQGQIFEQLAQRWTAGQPKATVAQTLMNLRRGPLGTAITDTLQDPAQQAMMAQYMVERAKGTKMDLSDNSAMAKLLGTSSKDGNSNPLLPMYDLNSNQAQNASKVEQGYIDGMTTAIGKIKELNDQFGNMGTELAKINAYLQVLTSSNAFQGRMQQIQTQNNALKQGADAVTAGALQVAGASAIAGFVDPAMWAVTLGALATAGVSSVVGAVAPAVNTANQTGNLLNPYSGSSGPVIPGGGPGGPIPFGPGGPSSTIAGSTMSDTGSQSGYKHVLPTSGKVTAPFGATGGIWGSGTHHGTDYGVADGTPVVAAADGVVDSSTVGSGPFSYGKYVVIDHGNGYKTLYAHLSQASVYPGDKVTAGQQIASSGHSGHATGPHLHFEVQKNGTAVDPSAFLGGAAGIDPKNAKYVASAKDPNSGPLSVSNLVPGITNLDPSSFTSIIPPDSSIITTGTTGITGVSSTVSLASASKSTTGTDGGTGGSASTMTLGGFSSYGAGAATGVAPKIEINLSIANASESEARKFATLVKSYLEQDLQTSNMGRF